MPFTDADVQMVAVRLGLQESDVPEIRAALEDVGRLGFDGFVDQTLGRVAEALEAAQGGQLPDEATLSRAHVRRRIAEGLAEMLHMRQILAAYDGPVN